ATLGLEPILLSRKKSEDIKNWYRIFILDKPVLAMGLRSAVFVPLRNLGLIIVEDEPNPNYKNIQAPYYHVRDVSLVRRDLQKVNLILGANLPSLESFYLIKRRKAKYLFLPSKRKEPPEIKIIRPQKSSNFKKSILSVYIQDQINQAIQQKEKVLLCMNRRGFATFIYCQSCGVVLKCPRCNINLVYHFENKNLRCHYCNFKSDLPKICTVCNSGYIKYKGGGIEKIENQIACFFPNAKVERYDRDNKVLNPEFDICIATKGITDKMDLDFSLAIILKLENFLNQMDFRAEEKMFYFITKLFNLTGKRLIVESFSLDPDRASILINKNFSPFYEEELKKRKETRFPPFWQIISLRLRGRNQTKVLQKTKELFEKLRRHNKNKNIEIFSYGKFYPEKLRDNYYAQILIKTKDVFTANKFIKGNLKKFSHSGIILTIDVDPIF
ncbi:MAG: primosomal protein N', partial [Candidatus Omnitrophica bacterium]|nr:primosomal protein N' [Candidatus Omnitrophota bacterium]